MKRRIVVGAITAMFAVAACGGASTPTPPPPASEAPGTSEAPGPSPSATSECAGGKTATITFWHTYNTDGPENAQLLDVVLPAFKRKCPNITVDSVVQPYDGLHDTLVAAVSGGGLPDVMRMDIIWTPEFAKLGALVKMDDLPGFSALKDAVFPGPLATNLYKGHYYGLPLDTNTQVLIRNTDLVPNAPATLDDVRAAAEALKGKPDTWGLSLGGTDPWNILPWFWTAGGQVTDENYTKATGYLDSPASIQALQWLVDMNKDGLIGPAMLGGSPDNWGGFAAGNYAMLTDGPWFFPIIAKGKPNIVGSPMPKGPGGSISVVGGENIVIFSTSPNQDAAWAFAQYMMSEEAQTAMIAVGQISALKSLATSDAVKRVDYYPPFMAQLETAKPRTVTPAWPQMAKILSDAFQAALRGSKTSEQALKDAASQIDPLLAQQ